MRKSRGRLIGAIGAVALVAGAGQFAGSAYGQTGSTGSAHRTARAAHQAAPPTYPWTEAHGDAQLSGVSADPTITTANASRLGVSWMANLTSPDLNSPVVGYNQQLGETLVYAGTESGWFSAFDASTGNVVWSDYLGSAIRMTPVIDGPNVWVADTYSPLLFKLNAATGAQECSTPIYAVAEASPIVVTPPGGSPTVFMGSNDLGDSGPLYSINEADCSVNWQFTNYGETTGIWDFLSYGVDATGEPLVLFGTADPDAEIYAVDAVTGARVWTYQAYNPGEGPYDIGAGVTVALPGSTAGGADGAAFVASKNGYMYALDMTTGALLWQYNYSGQFPPTGNGSRSTAALSGSDLVFGSSYGVYDLDATTGTLRWSYPTPKGDEFLGAVAIAGPAGQQVVLATAIDGSLRVLSLSDGSLLYTYQTHNYIASSPAVVDGNVLLTSADGFLYDFALGGGNAAAPSTVVTSPVNSSTVANPNGNLTISGTASDPTGVSSVEVAVQQGGQTGEWWDAATQSWQAGPADNPTVLDTPGATSVHWSLTVPVSAAGGGFAVWASAVNSEGIADTSSNSSHQNPSRAGFVVSPSQTAPTLVLGASRAAPGQTLTLRGGGFTPGENVTVSMATKPVTTLAVIQADSNGLLPPTSAVLPTHLNFGPITVSAVGQTSGFNTTAVVVVANNWDQWADNPTRTDFEPNDSALNNNVASSGKYYLGQAWNFPVGSAINSSVAIDQGVAFFGDDAGNEFAVDVHSGSLVWEASEPAGVDSSAAVDQGLVIVGTKADTVSALSEANGNPVWTTSTAGAVESSPLVAGGVVYVGDDSGNLYALNESTGAIIWTTRLAGAVKSSPTLDAPKHLVLVGDSSGAVSAVSLTSQKLNSHLFTPGAVVWSARTGGAVVASPLFYSGRVFVGSGDGYEYALNPLTGAVLWTFRTGGPIVAANVSFGQTVGVGSGDGSVYYLQTTNGALVNELVGSVPIVGMAGSVNFAVATLSNGAAFATRITGIDQTWKLNTDGYAISSAPVVNDGNVYITGADDNLRVFSAAGRPVY